MTTLPTAIGKYRVLRELGRGASSTVYLAEDPFRERHVAVKLLHAHLMTQEGEALRHRKALRNEAALAGRMRHPCIVRVLDADIDAEPPYVVFEYVEGESLLAFTRPERLLPVEQVLDICFKCCSALEYAHMLGLVHRDVKPANLLLRSGGDVMVTDFGMALAIRGEFSQVGGLVGSPQYMSPEQVREEPCTWRSDMFSLALVAYELLTGRRPFQGESDYTTMYKIANDEPVAPSVLRPELPEKLDAVLLRALAKKPRARYGNWMDFADALLKLSRGITTQEVRHREADAFTRMRELKFFEGFTDSVLWEALRLGTLMLRPAGRVLMEEGAIGDSFLLLLDGEVAVLTGGWKLTTLHAGETIGEMAYLRRDEPRRTAGAVAETAVLVLEIRNEALRHASDDLRLAFDNAFINLLLHRLMKTTEELGRTGSGGLVVGGA